MKKRNTETYILGIRFKAMKKDEAYDKLEDLLSRRGNARVFTPNSEILYKAHLSSEYSAILNSADMLLPDGIGVIAASYLLGSPLPQRITGIDAAEHILHTAAKNGLLVFLLGGETKVADAAAATLIRKYPKLNICGTHYGFFDRYGAENQILIQEINKASPDILFVCLGYPLQEEWIDRNSSSIPSLRLSMGLGGSLDVWSGKTKRAPRAVRKMGLEWLARALSDVNHMRRARYLWLFAVKILYQSIERFIPVKS